MPTPAPSSPHDNAELAIKNVKAFSDDHLIVGIPQGLFMLGIAVMVTSYFVTKLLWLPVLMAGLYYTPMYHMHRDDPRGLQVWCHVVSSSTLVWEAGRRKPFRLTFL